MKSKKEIENLARKKVIENLVKRIEKNEEFVFGLSYEDETTSFYTNNYFEVTKDKTDDTYYFVIDEEAIFKKVGTVVNFKQELIKVYDSFKVFVTKGPADSIVGSFINKTISLKNIYDITSLTSSKDLEVLLGKLAFVVNSTIAVIDGNGVI